MDSRESPFHLGWYTCGNHPDFWGEGGSTYTLIPYTDLPPLDDVEGSGSFEWLPVPHPHDEVLAFEERTVSPSARLTRLAEQASRERVSIPASFSTFVSEPRIHQRVPTCTACYLDLAVRLIQAPGGVPGRLLRFMNDQQSVLLWYLYLRPDGQHAVVVCTPEWPDEEDGETLEDVVRLTEILFCAPTFDEFIRRFWIENAIWYALYEARQLTPEQRRYLDAARRRLR